MDKPIIFNFHGYPWLIHRLTYRRTNHKNLHVRGYKEKGNINTPLDLAIEQRDRPLQPGDRRDRPRPELRASGAHAKEKLRNMQIECRATPTRTASTSRRSLAGSGRTGQLQPDQVQEVGRRNIRPPTSPLNEWIASRGWLERDAMNESSNRAQTMADREMKRINSLNITGRCAGRRSSSDSVTVTRLEDSSRQNKTKEFPPVGMNEEEDNDFV